MKIDFHDKYIKMIEDDKENYKYDSSEGKITDLNAGESWNIKDMTDKEMERNLLFEGETKCHFIGGYTQEGNCVLSKRRLDFIEMDCEKDVGGKEIESKRCIFPLATIGKDIHMIPPYKIKLLGVLAKPSFER